MLTRQQSAPNNRRRTTGQAIDFFGGLSEAGAEAALAVNPEDDHSLRGYWLGRHSRPAS